MGCAQSTEATPATVAAQGKGTRKSGSGRSRRHSKKPIRFKTAGEAAIFIQHIYKRRITEKARASECAIGTDQVSEDNIAVKLQSIWRGNHDRAWIKRQKLKFNDNHNIKQIDRANFKKNKKDLSRLATLNDYHFTTLLGKGSYGEVFKASHAVHLHHETVAIKVLKRPTATARRASLHPSARRSSVADGQNEMLKKEIFAMKKLNHPNVVELFEIIDDSRLEQIYLVMELVNGGTLAKPIEQKRVVPEPELRHWMRGLVLGLEHLHLNGVAHMDVKPENILLCSKTKEPKLADFGVSSLFSTKTLGGDYTHATGGTPSFFAPEMCHASAGGFSAKAADWWALGVCLYSWLYHETPYTAPTAMMLLEKIATEEVVYPDVDLKPQYKSALQLKRLMEQLLQKSPAKRYGPKGLRRDTFITDFGTKQLPSPAGNVMASMRGKVLMTQFSNAITEVVVRGRFAKFAKEGLKAESSRSDAVDDTGIAV